MTFLKKLFGIKAKPKTETIKFFGKDYVVDVSPEAMEIRQQQYEENKKNSWIGTNEVEKIRDDGYVIYQSNWVSFVEQEQIGFYGLKWYSENNNYCVVYSAHNDQGFNLALIEVNLKKVLYRIKLERPHRCRLTNDGIVICEDWGGYDSPSCCIYVLNNNGDQLVKKRHNTGIGDIFELFDNEKKFKYNINQTGKVFIIDNLK